MWKFHSLGIVCIFVPWEGLVWRAFVAKLYKMVTEVKCVFLPLSSLTNFRSVIGTILVQIVVDCSVIARDGQAIIQDCAESDLFWKILQTPRKRSQVLSLSFSPFSNFFIHVFMCMHIHTHTLLDSRKPLENSTNKSTVSLVVGTWEGPGTVPS